MAPSVCDDHPEETSQTSFVAEDSFGRSKTHSFDDTLETASLTLDDSRSLPDEYDEDDTDQQIYLQEPTDNEELLQIMTGTEEEMVAAVEAVWRQDSKDIWGVEELRPIQLKALWHIVDHDSLLLVSRTGSGKTHFIRMMGTELGGIVVVVVPLLALMGDQMTKMKSVDGSVEAYNVDQLTEHAGDFVGHKLIPRMRLMEEGTASTIFLFVSPFHLSRNPCMIDAIVDANKRNVLCGIGIDEAHLLCLQSSFRMCIRMLEDMLWKRIFTADNSDTQPKFFAMSATMTEELVDMLKKLVGGAVDLSPSMRIWPGRDHFEQRSIDHVYYTRGGNNPYQLCVKAVVDLITTTADAYALVFTTLESNSIRILESIEKALNKAKCEVYFVHVSGSKDKHTKFTLLQLLNEQSNPLIRGMVATGAANTGIDLKNVQLAVRCGVPPDMITYLQERGRLAREEGAVGKFIVLANIDSVAEQLWLIHNPAKKEREDSEEAQSFIGANSALFTDGGRDAARRKGKGANEERLLKEENKLKPRGQEIRKIRERAENMLYDVLVYLFLNKGCQHVIAEQFCAEGKLQGADPSVAPCGDSCPVCRQHNNGKRVWDEIFHKMFKRQVIAFLESRIVQDVFPLTVKDGSLANLLWNSDEWVLKIFGEQKKKKIQKHMVESAFLQLIAAKIIVAEYEAKGKVLKWVLNREGDSLCYKIDSYWTGINLYEESM